MSSVAPSEQMLKALLTAGDFARSMSLDSAKKKKNKRKEVDESVNMKAELQKRAQLMIAECMVRLAQCQKPQLIFLT